MELTLDDRVQILEAYARYCIDFDAGRAAQAAAHFADDGRFVYSGSREFEGRDAIREMFERRQSAAPGIRHFVTNIVLDATPAGVSGRAYVLVLRMSQGAPLRVVTIGEYEDTWVKLGRGWRIQMRVFNAWLDASLIDAPLLEQIQE